MSSSVSADHDAGTQPSSPARILYAVGHDLQAEIAALCRDLGHDATAVNDMQEVERVEGTFDLVMLCLGRSFRSDFSDHLCADALRGRYPRLHVARGLLLNTDHPTLGLQDAYFRLCSDYCQLQLKGNVLTEAGRADLAQAIGKTLRMPPYANVNYYKDGPVNYDVLHSVVESNQAPVMVLSPDDRVVFANMVAHALFHRPPYLLSGTPIRELLASEDSIGQVEALLETARTMRGATAELRLMEENGRRFDAVVLASRVFRTELPPGTVAITFYDITQRKRAEEALRQAHAEMATINRNLELRNQELEKALAEIKTLRGLIPICMHCKKIRDDHGFWQNVETYVRQHTEATFSHGLCPACLKTHYPDMADRLNPGS